IYHFELLTLACAAVHGLVRGVREREIDVGCDRRTVIHAVRCNGESAGTGPVRDLAMRGSPTASNVGHRRSPTPEQHAWTRPRRRVEPNALVLLGKGRLFGVPVIPGATAGPSSAVVPL